MIGGGDRCPSSSTIRCRAKKNRSFQVDAGACASLYVCGPTVYDYVHIGNARPVVAFDVLYRLLKRRYPRVTYVRNITDIDDRIMVRAADNRARPSRRSPTCTSSPYQSDMRRLGALHPTSSRARRSMSARWSR